jgi:hypothetical protein
MVSEWVVLSNDIGPYRPDIKVGTFYNMDTTGDVKYFAGRSMSAFVPNVDQRIVTFSTTTDVWVSGGTYFSHASAKAGCPAVCSSHNSGKLNANTNAGLLWDTNQDAATQFYSSNSNWQCNCGGFAGNTCQFARDGVCDTGGFNAACNQGTDNEDCCDTSYAVNGNCQYGTSSCRCTDTTDHEYDQDTERLTAWTRTRGRTSQGFSRAWVYQQVANKRLVDMVSSAAALNNPTVAWASTALETAGLAWERTDGEPSHGRYCHQVPISTECAQINILVRSYLLLSTFR